MFEAIQCNCEAEVALTNKEYRRLVKAGGIKSMFSRHQVRDGSRVLVQWTVAHSARCVGLTQIRWPELDWCTLEKLQKQGNGVSAELDVASPEQLAFLQYTSGSTAQPKGVMITHGNLAHNLSTIVHQLEAGTDTVVASWLPQYVIQSDHLIISPSTRMPLHRAHNLILCSRWFCPSPPLPCAGTTIWV